MFARIKSRVFIDALKLEFQEHASVSLKAVLKDDSGSVCRLLEKSVATDQKEFTWDGLNELPYGIYTLELSSGAEEVKMQLVKRI